MSVFHNADNKGRYSNGDAAVGGGGGGTRLLFDDGSTNIMHDDANPPTKFSPQVGVDAVLAAVEAEMRVALTAAGADRRDRRPIDIEHALAAALAATRAQLGSGERRGSDSVGGSNSGCAGGVNGAATAFDEAAVPLSGFSLAIKAEMGAVKAKKGGKNSAALAAIETRLEASRALDITAHKETELDFQYIKAHKEELDARARVAELNARKTELDFQYLGAITASGAAEDYERCGTLTREKEAVAAQLEAGRVRLEATRYRRAKAWAAAGEAMEMRTRDAAEKERRRKVRSEQYSHERRGNKRSALVDMCKSGQALDIANVREYLALGFGVQYQVCLCMCVN